MTRKHVWKAGSLFLALSLFSAGASASTSVDAHPVETKSMSNDEPSIVLATIPSLSFVALVAWYFGGL